MAVNNVIHEYLPPTCTCVHIVSSCVWYPSSHVVKRYLNHIKLKKTHSRRFPKIKLDTQLNTSSRNSSIVHLYY